MNIDDLLFKNRNKEYGAYFLRKKYTITLIISLFITILLVFIFFIVPLFINAKNKNNNEFIIKVEISPLELSLIENMPEVEPKVEKQKIEKLDPKLEDKEEPLPIANKDSANDEFVKKDSALNAENQKNINENIDPRIKLRAEFSCGSDFSSFRNWFVNNFHYTLNQPKISGKISLQLNIKDMKME